MDACGRGWRQRCGCCSSGRRTTLGLRAVVSSPVRDTELDVRRSSEPRLVVRRPHPDQAARDRCFSFGSMGDRPFPYCRDRGRWKGNGARKMVPQGDSAAIGPRSLSARPAFLMHVQARVRLLQAWQILRRVPVKMAAPGAFCRGTALREAMLRQYPVRELLLCAGCTGSRGFQIRYGCRTRRIAGQFPGRRLATHSGGAGRGRRFPGGYACTGHRTSTRSA